MYKLKVKFKQLNNQFYKLKILTKEINKYKNSRYLDKIKKKEELKNIFLLKCFTLNSIYYIKITKNVKKKKRGSACGSFCKFDQT